MIAQYLLWKTEWQKCSDKEQHLKADWLQESVTGEERRGLLRCGGMDKESIPAISGYYTHKNAVIYKPYYKAKYSKK